jgi:Fe-S-cluster-containing dehydrogenase component/formate-dependent nitrite reductase membrane component NrfD
MMKYGFVIDQRKCIGCHACTVACKAEHGVPIGVYRTWVKYIEKGEFPNTRRHFLVNRCNHCDDAPCVAICPTQALFKRADGIVDFDRDCCIGCKSCMQACPYDALYIDPNTHTAAKCNYCVHRVDLGLQPACVVVCPEQAIIAGDLHDPNSQIAQLVGRESVRVRRPEQGTGPNVYYIGADEHAINPEVLPAADLYMFMKPAQLTSMGTVAPPPTPAVTQNGMAGRESELSSAAMKLGGDGARAKQTGTGLFTISATEARAMELRAQGVVDRRTYRGAAQVDYDIPKAQPWGWMVSAYLGTKSIAGGAFLVTLLALGVGLAPIHALFGIAAPIVALIFLGLTLLLLVADLKRPERFWYILLKSNWTSWLVWGGWILQIYGALLAVWLAGEFLSWAGVLRVLVWPTALFGAAAAGYTAFLFGQAEGRDFWQSPLLLPHLLVQAFLAGASVLALIGLGMGSGPIAEQLLARVLLGALIGQAILIGSELFVPHTNHHVAAAGHIITSGALRYPFWILAVGLGICLALAGTALAMLTLTPAWIAPSAVAALVGLFAYEHCFVVAGQAVPLS